jgi:HK97 family phage major capsid protein
MNLKLYNRSDRQRAAQNMRAIVDKAEREKRDLTDEEAKEFDYLDSAIKEFDTSRKQKRLNNEVNSILREYYSSELHEQRGENFMKAASRSDSSRVPFDVRAVMTPEAGSLGNTQVKSTSPTVYTQQTGSAAFMSAFNMEEATNNQTMPFLDRTDRLTAQNKGFTDALTQQALIISAYLTSLKNYYAHPVWHRDVARDAAGGIGQQIFDWSAQDIQRQIASDSLWGDGSSNNITGLNNLAGVQTMTAPSPYNSWAPMIDAVQLLHSKNVDPSNISVIMSPGAWGVLQYLAATDNQPLLPPEGLNFANIFVTSLIPDNQGSGNNETTIFVGDMSKVNLYMDGMYTLAANQRYVEFDYDAAVMVMRADLKSFEPDHICKITGVVVGEATT